MGRKNKVGRRRASPTPSTGSLAANLHEGGRSEYLAQYALSAFGPAVPVPRQEDTGIDLYCGLGEHVGKRLHVRAHYYVQIKSSKDDLEFVDPESVQWISNLPQPLFVCVATKNEGHIDLYQAVELPGLFVANELRSVRLTFESGEQFRGVASEVKNAVIRLGEPILSFDVVEIAKHQRREHLRQVLWMWVKMGQAIVAARSAGGAVLDLPGPYQTNEIPPCLGGAIYKVSEKAQACLDEALWRLLAVVLLQAGMEGGPAERFLAVKGAVEQLVLGPNRKWGLGLKVLQVAMQETCKRRGVPNSLRLTRAPKAEEKSPAPDLTDRDPVG